MPPNSKNLSTKEKIYTGGDLAKTLREKQRKKA